MSTIWLRSTSSTMHDAIALAAKGEPHGTVVVAEEQTAGMGRHGQVWHSEFGGGLYLSIILRLSEARPILTMALGLAVQRAVNDFAGVAADLRWPNDVLLNSRKIAGIMVQTADGDAVIAGIGLNVNQQQFPPDLRGIATSLRIETGEQHSKEDLLERVIAECLRYAALDRPAVVKCFHESSSYACGKEVIVNGKLCGITAGLDDSGFLLLRTPAGIETIISGGVRPYVSDATK